MSRVRITALLLGLICACLANAGEPALVKVPVACIRTHAGHSSELSSQVVLGTPVEILAKSGDWCHVSTPDGYTGYIISNSLKELTAGEYTAWTAANKVVCRSWLSRLITSDGLPAGYAVYGAVLAGEEALDSPGMVAIHLPDGRLAYASADDFYPSMDAYKEACAEAGTNEVISVAYSMLGIPYLWGGTSSLAADCSGFTQMAYRAAGLLLPRDTSMQIKCGEPVVSLADALPGDLIFYGNKAGKVNHVAIYLGEGKIIHSSGHVRICRMSADVPGTEELFTQKPLTIRRVLGVKDPAGVDSIFNNTYYAGS